jgi:hypothetical protein
MLVKKEKDSHKSRKNLQSLKQMNNENVRVEGLKLPSASKRPSVAEALHDFFLYLLFKFKIPIIKDAVNISLDLSESKSQPVLVDTGVLANEIPLPCYMEKYINQTDLLPTNVVTYLTLADDLHSYFNAILPRSLLYERELDQYNEFVTEIRDENEKRSESNGDGGSTTLSVGSLLDENLNAAELYGVEYLLRMIVKMPSLINQSTSDIPKETQQIVADMLQDLSL